MTLTPEVAQGLDINDVRETEGSESFQHQLVEGDFFPSAVDDISVDPELIAELTGSNPGLMMAEDEVELIPHISRPKRSAIAKGGSDKKKKRVRWADKVDLDISNDASGCSLNQRLLKHVKTFCIPLSSEISSYSLDEANVQNNTTQFPTVGSPPPSIFREKKNTDGSVYKFCKAQRPSIYFIEWGRQPHGADQVPFRTQPVEIDTVPSKAMTLFSALYPKEPRSIPGDYAKARVATGAHQTSRCPQLPFIRVDTLLNEPLRIPL
ncbi:unnamed protein product [Phytomonas sp. Hart1]|nr:unnamed protein product [Phytomonas sp. Hart1]|eukprot:CCW66228.1 unnamed protein product [Phytomonas sp. isolate Hart1]